MPATDALEQAHALADETDVGPVPARPLLHIWHRIAASDRRRLKLPLSTPIPAFDGFRVVPKRTYGKQLFFDIGAR
jgi:hypothetical protein